MATIKVYEDAYITRHDITLDIYHEKASYPDDYYEHASVTFPVPHLTGETVKVDYSDLYGQNVQAQMVQDISSYLEDPQEWTETLIKKGAGPVLELRQLECELAEAKSDHERYARYANHETEKIQRVEQRIAEHKAKHGL